MKVEQKKKGKHKRRGKIIKQVHSQVSLPPHLKGKGTQASRHDNGGTHGQAPRFQRLELGRARGQGPGKKITEGGSRE